jgi:hypothetical protein
MNSFGLLRFIFNEPKNPNPKTQMNSLLPAASARRRRPSKPASPVASRHPTLQRPLRCRHASCAPALLAGSRGLTAGRTGGALRPGSGRLSTLRADGWLLAARLGRRPWGICCASWVVQGAAAQPRRAPAVPLPVCGSV